MPPKKPEGDPSPSAEVTQGWAEAIKRAQSTPAFLDRMQLEHPRSPEHRRDRLIAATDVLQSALEAERAAELSLSVEDYRASDKYSSEKGELRRRAWDAARETRPDLVRYGLDRAQFAIWHCEMSIGQALIPAADRILADQLCEIAATLLDLSAGLSITLRRDDGTTYPGGDFIKKTAGGRHGGTTRQWAKDMVKQFEAAKWPGLYRHEDGVDRAAMLRDALQELFQIARKQRTARKNELKKAGQSEHTALAQANRETLTRLRNPVWNMTNECALLANEKTLDAIRAVVTDMLNGDSEPRTAAFEAAHLALTQREPHIAKSKVREAPSAEGIGDSWVGARLRSILIEFSTEK